MSPTEQLLLASAALVAAFLLGGRSASFSPALERFLSSRAAPYVFGAVTAVAVAWVWGSLRQIPLIHDEQAYVFQSRIFASGRWTAPPPPLPEAFEQPHILVSPRWAAKYPPGHALFMAPGALLGLAGLVPVLLSGAAGGMIFALARQAANPWVALLTWVLWLTTPDNLRFRASYFSQSTSTFLMLGAWWSLLRWRATSRTRWMLLLAAAIGWLAITRPLNAVALFLPIGAYVLWRVWSRAQWRTLAAGALVGIAVVALVPLWSARTTGDWRTTPLEHYTRAYIPWDVPGFGVVTTPALRELPPDLADWDRTFVEGHRTHTLARLPVIASSRVKAVQAQVWKGWRRPLLLLLGVALVTGSLRPRREAMFALGSVVLVFASYLSYQHFSDWTVYYLEIFPVLAFFTALAVWGIALRIYGWWRADAPAERRAAIAIGALAILCVPFAIRELKLGRYTRMGDRTYFAEFAGVAAKIPDERGLLLVRYGPHHPAHHNLIDNHPDLAHARLVVARDLGERNADLLAAFPQRAVYLYDEEARSLTAVRAGAPR